MDVARIRKRLHLTQAGLGRLVGAHAMTVSKWERGVLRPADFQRSVLAALEASASGREIPGAARDLSALLNQAFIEVTEVEGMKLSASNQFKGKVVHLDEGPVTTRVVIEVAPKVQITSLITTASVRRLGLRVGKQAVAIIKATEVIIGSK
jgi:molybdopterin-binding protein